MAVAVICDACERTVPTSVVAKVSPNAFPLTLPDGWHPVSFGGRAGIVCSHDCGALWIGKLAEEEAARTAGDPEASPHEWPPATWVAFCQHHGVSQADALRHGQDTARRLGDDPVHRWENIAGRLEVARAVRQFVLDQAAEARAS